LGHLLKNIALGNKDFFIEGEWMGRESRRDLCYYVLLLTDIDRMVTTDVTCDKYI
jgi:hypothetical protein